MSQKSRHAHQVTAASLSILKRSAYNSYVKDLPTNEDIPSFETWETRCAADCPQFQYWNLTIQFQLLILIFIRAQRDCNFQLYLESLHNLIPRFFALDQTNYVRWLPADIPDLMNLAKVYPNDEMEFRNEHFVINKTARVSSAISIYQAHEQNNAMVKGTEGAVGFTENPSAFRRWMVSGADLDRILNEFETDFSRQQNTGIVHHEQVHSAQAAFRRHVKSLVSIF